MSEIPEAAIEAAARALCEDDLLNPDDWDPTGGSEGQGRPNWDDYTNPARVALNATLPHLTPAPQVEGDVREGLMEVIHDVSVRGKQVSPYVAGVLADAVLSSGLVVPAAIHKVATDALETGDACGAVGCRALADRDAAVGTIDRVRMLADALIETLGDSDRREDVGRLDALRGVLKLIALDTTPRA